MDDVQIAKSWQFAKELYAARYGYRTSTQRASGDPLCVRLADRILQRLEDAGVTEGDIDRLGLA